MFKFVLVQTLRTKTERKTFLRPFVSMLPPAIGQTLAQFAWNCDGDKIDSIWINHHGVCFVTLKQVDMESASTDEINDWMESFADWFDYERDTDIWRMSQQQLMQWEQRQPFAALS